MNLFLLDCTVFFTLLFFELITATATRFNRWFSQAFKESGKYLRVSFLVALLILVSVSLKRRIGCFYLQFFKRTFFSFLHLSPAYLLTV